MGLAGLSPQQSLLSPLNVSLVTGLLLYLLNNLSIVLQEKTPNGLTKVVLVAGTTGLGNILHKLDRKLTLITHTPLLMIHVNIIPLRVLLRLSLMPLSNMPLTSLLALSLET